MTDEPSDLSDALRRLPERLAYHFTTSGRSLALTISEADLWRHRRKCCPHCGLPQ